MPGEETVQTPTVAQSATPETKETSVTMEREAYENLISLAARGAEASEKLLSHVEEGDEEVTAQQIEEARQQALSGAATPEEFAQLVLDLAKEQANQMIQPVAQTVMSLLIQNEITTTQNKYSDFDDYRDDVYKIMQTNTRMSVEEAYLLASAKKGKAPTVKAKGEDVTTPARRVISGERPNAVSRDSVDVKPNLTMKDAAKEAFKRIYGSR